MRLDSGKTRPFKEMMGHNSLYPERLGSPAGIPLFPGGYTGQVTQMDGRAAELPGGGKTKPPRATLLSPPGKQNHSLSGRHLATRWRFTVSWKDAEATLTGSSRAWGRVRTEGEGSLCVWGAYCPGHVLRCNWWHHCLMVGIFSQFLKLSSYKTNVRSL